MLDSFSSEQDFANFIDEVKNSLELQIDGILAILPENHDVYHGRSATSMMRLRGYAIAAFYHTGLDEQALSYVVDVLENSNHAYAVAAAARTIRILEQPHPDLAKFLVNAIANIWHKDRPITFDSFENEWPLRNYTTALGEIFASLSYMGAYAKNQIESLENLKLNYRSMFNPETYKMMCECVESIKSDNRKIKTCCLKPLNTSLPQCQKSVPKSLNSIELQDQDGFKLHWQEFFQNKLSLVAFFYITCTNPKKCSQTIYNLADIQKALTESGLEDNVQISAITYTSDKDSPEALKDYGLARGLIFNEHCKMFRCSHGVEILLESLDLQVNFIGGTVNQHSIELFFFNEQCELIKAFPRLQTAPPVILNEVKSYISRSCN